MQKTHGAGKFIVVTGGVISGVGKGVVTASIAKLIQEYGYRVTVIKIDPYINYDAGTLRPTEHGEVWVTADGGEIDQDLGTYERFLNIDIPKQNNITSGQIYHAVLDKERKGEYLGQTVQFIPHITDEVLVRIKQAASGYDVTVIEVGGTVGDYENVPFLFAIKTLEREVGKDNIVHVLVTYLPVPAHIGEMKTKPTQQAIRLLGQEGIVPDFIVCRAHTLIDEVRKKKIEALVHIPLEHILSAPDIDSIYQQPGEFAQQKFGEKLLRCLHLSAEKEPDLTAWQERVNHMTAAKKRLSIAIVGKYLATGSYSLTDSYLSICHALMHAGAELGRTVEISWIDAKKYEEAATSVDELGVFDGVIVPGGFGGSGVEGKIRAIEYVRTRGIPYLGICYGMQLAVVAYARHVCGLEGANTTEIDLHTPHPVIDLLPLQHDYLQDNRYGGTMRLGAYKAQVDPSSRVHALYTAAGRIVHQDGHSYVAERHRHRYEVNPAYVSRLEGAGMIFSGKNIRPDGTQLMEFLELRNHPFFVATQAHPEFTSRLANPNPLFYGFVAAACAAQTHKPDQLEAVIGCVRAPLYVERQSGL